MNKSQFSWFASRVKKGREKGDSARQVGRLGRQVEQEGRGGRTKAFQSRFLLLTYAGAALLATWGLGPAAGQRVSWISSIGGSGQQSTVTTACPILVNSPHFLFISPQLPAPIRLT